MSSSSSSSNSRIPSSHSLPQINDRGLMEARDSPSGVSQALTSVSSSRLQTSDGPKTALVARPSTSVGFHKAPEFTTRNSRPSSPARSWMHEVAEQIKSLKADMEQKDATIAKLRSDNSQLQARVRSERESHSLQTLCSQILQYLDGSNASGVANDHLPQLAIERASALAEERKHLSRQVADLRTRAEEASSELAAERVHTTSQQNELKQTKDVLAERQQQVEQLRGEVERLEQNSARQTSLVQSLRQQVQDLDNERSHKSSERMKFDTTISELRQETQSQKRQIAEKQQQLQMQLETVKATEQKAAKLEERYETLCSSIGELLEVEGAGLMTSLDDMLISKVTEILQENNDLRSHLSSLKSSLEACDMDARAGRETIMRLVSEVSKEQKAAVSHQEDRRKLQLERETTEQQNAQSLQEIETLKGQISATHSAWTDSKADVQTKEAQIVSLEAQLHAGQQQIEELHAKIEAFSTQLSHLLTSSGFEASGNESAILGKVQEVASAHKNTESLVGTLEHQVNLLKQQVGEHEHLSASAIERAHNLESQLKEKDEQIQALEKEILAVDTIKDDLKKDKEKYVEFSNQLCETLHIGQLTTSLGLEVNSEVLLARVQQLVKQEGEALAEKTVALSSLQRKMKSTRKDVESRDLHITLLQKKIAAHEEKLAYYYKRESEEASAVDKAKKLQKQLDRSSKRIDEQKVAMTEMKARLHDVDEYRTQGVEYLHKIRQCEQTIEELAAAKGRLSKQLASTQKRLETRDAEMRDSTAQNHQTLQTMQDDLGSKERALTEAREREQQLVQFRHALSQVLGLDGASTIPDYDIVSRVEKLVAAEQSHLATSQTLEANLRQLGNSFQSSYTTTMRLLSPQRAQQAAEGSILANIRHLPSDFAMRPV